MRARWLSFALAVWALFVATIAEAQIHPPRIGARVDPADVEVGESFEVVAEATSESGAPSASEPRFAPPPGMSVAGPSIGTRTSVQIVGGHFEQSSTIVATWRLTTSREGTFAFAGPTFAWNGARYASSTLTVRVRPRGTLGRRPDPRARGRSPLDFDFDFDPFAGMPSMGSPFGARPSAPPAPTQAPEPVAGGDPELTVEVPPDTSYFLHAVPSRRAAVVGEAVVLTVYLYARAGSYELADVHEPTVPKFVRRDLLPPGTPPEAKIANVGGALWRAQPIFKASLVPLEAGDLEIGPMRVGVKSTTRGGRTTGVRESEPLRIRVTEPPLASRPPGYELGDVGTFTLSATVEPRSTEVGSATSVVVSIEGFGNAPRALHTPTQPAVEWLEPTVKDTGEVAGDKLRVSRTLTYVVRPKQAGTFDLGELRLPYFDPEKRAYDVAKFPLGSINVRKGSAPDAPPEPTVRDPFVAVGAPRATLGAPAEARAFATDRGAFWAALFGAPLSVIALGLAARASRAASSALARRKKGAAAAISKSIDLGREAAARADAGTVAASVERAVYLAIEETTTLRARALLLAELVDALVRAGVAPELAEATRELLRSVDVARFAGATAAELRALVDEGERVARELRRAFAARKS